MIWAGANQRWQRSQDGSKDASQLETYSLGCGEGTHSSTGESQGYTFFSKQRQQPGGIAPCADGLAWDFDGEGFDHSNNKLNNNAPVDLLHVAEKRVALAPVSTAGSGRRDATTSSPQSSLTSIVPSLELLAHGGRSSGEEEDDGDEEQVARTFSSIDESLEQDEHQEGLSTHRRTAGGPGTRRRYARSEDDNNGGGHNESMSPASVDENGSAGRLQGLIPGDGQNTFAAQFFSSHPHSHLSAMAVERSMGSIVDTTSAFWSGIAGSGSVLSPGDVSIKTASSMCVGEEREATGGWGEHEYKESGEENENWEDEDDSTEGWDDKQEEEEDGDEESDQGQRRFGTFDEEEKMSPSAEDKAQARGSAASVILGMNAESKERGVPTSKGSGDGWDADDTPRLDDYFRGQANVPPSEEQLLPPPFGGGEDGSPLFPSPPQDGKAIYGLRTWSFGSDSGGGGSGGGGGDEQAPWKPSAASPSATKQQTCRDYKPSPAESFAFHGGRAKAEVKANRKGGQQVEHQDHCSQQQQQQQQQQREDGGNSSRLKHSTIGTSTVRGNSLPRRGRFLVQASQHQNHNRNRPQQPKQATSVIEEEERGKRSVSNSNSNNNNNAIITNGVRRRSGGNGGGGVGGHQKRHQEFLIKFGQEKRMERQEEEAKAQRREAARRRTRDLLLERAKQRLLAVSATASSVAGQASSNSNSNSLAAGPSGKGPIPSGAEGGDDDSKGSAARGVSSTHGGGGRGDASATGKSSSEGGVGATTATTLAALSAGIPLYAQETWAARHSKVERKGNEKDVAPEEKERLEKEKFERIAATRRRQKEHHKRFLAALKAKRVQEEENRLLHERKEAEKRCNVKMWAERRLQKVHKSSGGGGIECLPESDGGSNGKGARDGRGGDEAGMAVGGVAGSGLNAIRKAHSRSEDEGGGSDENVPENVCLVLSSTASTTEELEKAAKLAHDLEKEERRRRFFEIKMAKEKAQRHLETLTKKKKEKEDEEEHAKRRKARRMKLLRDKVLCMAKELRQSGEATEMVQCPGTGPESGEENKSDNVTARAPRLTDEELQASVERLTQQRKGGGVITASARDFADWKRKHRVPSETKVFVMTGWYPCVKKALIERGWTQNPDRDSPFFDLKWTLHSQDIRTTDIEPWQLCNHFFKNVAITTKAGLLGNLRNLKWFADCDCGEILPRGYDLSVESDVLAFLDDYCATAAESLLKHVLLRAKGRVALRDLSISTASSPSPNHHVRLDKDAALRSMSNEEDQEEERGDKAAERNRGTELNGDDERNGSYNDDDDAFDDSSVDDGTDQESPRPPSRRTTSPEVTPPASLSAVSPTATRVPPIDSLASDIYTDDPTASSPPPRRSPPTLDVPNECHGQQQQQQQQTPEMPATSTSAHVPTSVAPTPRTEEVAASVTQKMEGASNRGSSISTDMQDRDVAHPTGVGGQNSGGDGVRRLRRQAPPISARRRQWEPEGAGIEVNAEILGAALAVCRRRHASVGEEGEGGLDSGGSAVEAVCSELEWELIGLGTGGGAPHPDMPGLYRSHCLPSRPASPLEAFVQSQAEKEALSGSGAREERRRRKQQDGLRAACAERVRTVVPLGEAMLDDVQAVLERAAKASRSQFNLNGDFCQNMWIVKPAAKSRGRGIECFTELDKLLSYTESKQPQAVSQWVVHKYIENPLIIARRKFDMRQWVLVTDWNPLTVWFYDRCYVRFGVEEYTTSGSNIGNSFVHLVNNSICKKSDNFGKVSTTDNGVEVHEHMWSNEVFTAYVDEVAGEGCWRKQMQPRMEQIVTWSLLCAQDLVEHRKKSWELYGYDFMVDDQYKPWLIEINSSPACDYSTKVTEQYVQAALTDLLKVTIDLPEWEANQKRSRASSSPEQQQQHQASAEPKADSRGATESSESNGDGNRCREETAKPGSSLPAKDRGIAEEQHGDEEEEKPPDTGLWRLLYKGAFVPFPVASFGTDLALKGTRIANKRLRSSLHTVKL